MGPDGRRYAVGGEVAIDASRVPGDPQATIRKAQVIRRAALAPAAPSAQDQRVAAQATRMEQQARAELLRQQDAEDTVTETTETETVEPGVAGISTNQSQASGLATSRPAPPASQPGILQAIPADGLTSSSSLARGQRVDTFA